MGGDMTLVVKRKGHKERFDERKIYASIYAACASAWYSEIHCENISGKVTKRIKNSLKNKNEIRASLIKRKIISELKKIDKRLVFYYEEHLPNLKRL